MHLIKPQRCCVYIIIYSRESLIGAFGQERDAGVDREGLPVLGLHFGKRRRVRLNQQAGPVALHLEEEALALVLAVAGVDLDEEPACLSRGTSCHTGPCHIVIPFTSRVPNLMLGSTTFWCPGNTFSQ